MCCTQRCLLNTTEQPNTRGQFSRNNLQNTKHLDETRGANASKREVYIRRRGARVCRVHLQKHTWMLLRNKAIIFFKEFRLQLKTVQKSSPKHVQKQTGDNSDPCHSLHFFSPVSMALLQDPRIPCFFGAQSFTVNLEVSPKSPPILWKTSCTELPNLQEWDPKHQFKSRSKNHIQISGYCTASEMKLSGNTRCRQPLITTSPSP